MTTEEHQGLTAAIDKLAACEMAKNNVMERYCAQVDAVKQRLERLAEEYPDGPWATLAAIGRDGWMEFSCADVMAFGVWNISVLRKHVIQHAQVP
jgi:hypothetical protein